jgi:hypothetical protein
MVVTCEFCVQRGQGSLNLMIKGTPNSGRIVSLEFVDVDRAYDQFLAAVDDWRLERRIASGRLGTRARTPIAWLYDVRFAPAHRNDLKFEAAILARRPEWLHEQLASTATSRP